MKKNGILNGALNAAISTLGHGDLVVVADCGLPIPLGTPSVDLALVQGTPGFIQVLDPFRNDVIFEGCVAASESAASKAHEWITDRFPAAEYIPMKNSSKWSARPNSSSGPERQHRTPTSYCVAASPSDAKVSSHNQ